MMIMPLRSSIIKVSKEHGKNGVEIHLTFLGSHRQLFTILLKICNPCSVWTNHFKFSALSAYFISQILHLQLNEKIHHAHRQFHSKMIALYTAQRVFCHCKEITTLKNARFMFITFNKDLCFIPHQKRKRTKK